jgi:plasmid stability protein
VAKKVVKNFSLDEELIDALERKSATRRESMSLIVREALRSALSDELAR